MRPPNDAGFATPTAAVISLALAMVSTAVVTRSLAEFRLAKQDFAKSTMKLEMAAAHNAALLAIATSGQPPPYRWFMPSMGEAVEVLAEPEYGKMNAVGAAGLDASALSSFDVRDQASLAAKLTEVRPSQNIWVADADSSPTWRHCAPSFISAYGRAGQVTTPFYKEPDGGREIGNWRAGEVWRIVVADRNGWRDERMVRWTGNGLRPAAVIGERVYKVKGGFSACETLG